MYWDWTTDDSLFLTLNLNRSISCIGTREIFLKFTPGSMPRKEESIKGKERKKEERIKEIIERIQEYLMRLEMKLKAK